jgi:hypothetical protein
MENTGESEARRLMLEFAASTGLTGDRAPRRYLWTDAHAVCNFLGLAAATGDKAFRRLAVTLVDQVHHVLGRHREDDVRSGWISGVDEAEGQQHPTRGGLRIGKRLPERRRDESHNPNAEWDQDGQYYHYLTKWIHALLQMAGATGDRRYLLWARELAVAAHEGFRASSGSPRLFWKMSIDLSYPLVASSGLHDPLDGLVTALTLKAADPENGALDRLINDLRGLCRGRRWETDDPLGIGGLLFDAGRLSQLPGLVRHDNEELLTAVLEGAETGLEVFEQSPTLQQPGTFRLAFRELGLSIGLHAADLIARSDLPDRLENLIDRLQAHRKFGISIERFWSDPARQANATWEEHRDINTVMLATSLAPDGLLVLRRR